MSEAISKSAYAIRHGVAPSAVSNWIARRKLSGAALTADGRIVVEEADRQLDLTIDPARGRPSPPPRGRGDDGKDTLAALRIERETLALEAGRRAAALDAGELVNAAAAAKAWATELDDLLAAVELFVTDLPPKLGLGREAVDLVRREWRDFRRRRAQQAEAAAHHEGDARAA